MNGSAATVSPSSPARKLEMFRVATTSFLALATRLKRGGVIVNGHTLTRSQTRLQLEVLGRWFDFIRIEELPGRLANPAGRPFCLLTFDDGKRSNFTEIAPELEMRRVPAVFYVTTGSLSNGACLWFDRHEQLVRALGHRPVGLELETLKRLPFNVLMKRLDRAFADHGVAPDNEPDDLRPMSWDEARDLTRRGFTVGAHSVTHAILTRETNDRAFTEIEESLANVSSELDTPCKTFAFPNGNYTPELARHAMRCGATTVMTTEPTWTDARSEFWRLPRVQLFGEFTRGKIELKLALAALRGALANPDGTGREYWRRSGRSRTLRREPASLRSFAPVRAGCGRQSGQSCDPR